MSLCREDFSCFRVSRLHPFRVSRLHPGFIAGDGFKQPAETFALGVALIGGEDEFIQWVAIDRGYLRPGTEIPRLLGFAIYAILSRPAQWLQTCY